MIDAESREILCTALGEGSEHDFALFKASQLPIDEAIEVVADQGYQGIAKLHNNSYVPVKRRRKKPLSELESAYNRALSQVRIAIEHVNRRLKVFRILSERYRNRRCRHEERVQLIAAFYNWELYFAD